MDPIPIYLTSHPTLFLIVGLSSMAVGLALFYGTWRFWNRREEKLHDAFTFIQRWFDSAGSELSAPAKRSMLLIQATPRQGGAGIIFQTILEPGAELEYKGATQEKVRKNEISRAGIAVRVERDRLAEALADRS